MRDLIYLRNKLGKFLKENSTRKKALVINSYDRIDAIAGAIKGLPGFLGENTDILCFKSRIPEELNDLADRVKISEDYLEKEDYSKIDDYVFNDISRNWDNEAIKRYKGIFTYRNIELARLAEYDFQRFLIARIKALAVVTRAIKKENYEAIFIMDSNGELGNFDRLLSMFYRIPADFVNIAEKKSLLNLVRSKISYTISNIIDHLAPLFIRRKGRVKLIDARLFYQLGIENTDSFILTPLEKGLKLRLKCLLKNRGYVAFDLGHDGAKDAKEKEAKEVDIRFLRDRFIFEGIAYWELVKDKIGTLIWDDFDRFRRNIDGLSGAHGRHDIKSVVLRNDIRAIEKTIVLASKNINISSLVIQHGILANPSGHNIVFADKVAVWGKRAASWYKKFGNDFRKMAIVGNPTFDRMPDYRESGNSENFMNKLGLTKKKSLITLIGPGIGMFKSSSFTTDDVNGVLIRELISAVKSIGDANLVVKLHPNERVKTYAKLITRDNKGIAAVIDKTDMHKLIKASDLVIIMESTVALIALLMKKPIVVINLSKRVGLIPYVKNKVAIGAYRKEDIPGVLRKAMNDENAKKGMDLARESFINDFLYKTDGKATERILELIEKL